MFAQWFITIVLIALLSLGLYRFVMHFVRKAKFFQDKIDREWATLQNRLEELTAQRDKAKALKETVRTTEQLTRYEKEIEALKKKLTKLDAKRSKE